MAGIFLTAGIVLPDTVTLPVAASVVGVAPFFSDVRVFNTSYAGPVTVTATYRCAPGSSAACGTQPVRTFELAAREARAFDNISVSLFGVANSLGAVEFATDSGSIVVTSRLYSPAASPPWPAGTVGSVGMFIPGLPSSAASAVTVLTNLSNGGSATGSFRTNIGVYNPNPTTVTATVRLYESGSVLLGQTSLTLSGKTGSQISNIYQVVGFGSLVTTSGYATVESDAGQPLFTYAATADNATQDPILVVGVPDQPAPPGFHPPTPTPGASSPTPTPTAPAGATHTVAIGQSGNSFTDSSSGNSSTTVHVGDTVKWVWMGGSHSTTSGTCTTGGYYGGGCTADGHWDSGVAASPFTFSQTFTAAGTFKYFCGVHLGGMTGTVQVLP